MGIEKRINSALHSIEPYVPGKSVQEVTRAGNRADVVKMASNENPLGASPMAVDAIRGGIAGVHQYPEIDCPDLVQRLAERLEIEPDSLIVCNEADGVIYTLGLTLLERGDEVVIPEITFPVYETICRAMGSRVVQTRMDSYAIDLDDILRHITDQTKIIWLCNPNNPTGTLVDAEAFSEFWKRVPRDVLVVHDEVYRDFADPARFPDTVELIRKNHDNLFVIRSFSKVYGLAGMRVGFGVGAPGLVRMMYRVRPPFDVSVLAQKAATAALEDIEFYRQTIDITAQGKELLYRRLGQMKLSYVPSHTNFVLIDTGMDDARVCRRLLDDGIIARPAASYKLPNHIRITVGSAAQIERFLQALQAALVGL